MADGMVVMRDRSSRRCGMLTREHLAPVGSRRHQRDVIYEKQSRKRKQDERLLSGRDMERKPRTVSIWTAQPDAHGLWLQQRIEGPAQCMMGPEAAITAACTGAPVGGALEAIASPAAHCNGR